MRSDQAKFWMQILAMVSMVACSIAFLIATVGAATAGLVGPQADTGAQQTLEGMITCSRCGTRHSAAVAKNAADCARICAHLGAGFTLVDGDKVYQLDGDTNVLKKLATRRVHVVGEVEGTTIRISSIAPTD